MWLVEWEMLRVEFHMGMGSILSAVQYMYSTVQYSTTVHVHTVLYGTYGRVDSSI